MSWFKTHTEVEQERLEALASSIRSQRDKLLRDTDWVVLSDTPDPSTEMLTYRQALRDITNQTGFPENITWPEEVTND